MLRYNYVQFQAVPDDLIEVGISGKYSTIMLLDGINFSRFATGKKYRYTSLTQSVFSVPAAGTWYVVGLPRYIGHPAPKVSANVLGRMPQ